jgi:hypothetical protein
MYVDVPPCGSTQEKPTSNLLDPSSKNPESVQLVLKNSPWTSHPPGILPPSVLKEPTAEKPTQKPTQKPSPPQEETIDIEMAQPEN